MKFKVYSAEFERFGRKALIIVAYYKTKSDLVSEFFLVIPKNDSLKHGQISFDCQIPKGVDFKIDKRFVLKEALNQAKIDFGEYLSLQNKNQDRRLVDVITTTKEDSSFIAHLLFTGHYDSIKTIEKLTNCDGLKKYLNAIQKITMKRE
ncbi:MAG TPA: hypothetical protein PK055_10375 [Gammaproteobacteria bacterium]|nr:hypothetical protein [Gammaproteobacteria bacterium]HPQ88052.1 hypothetical protein [Gammaproteobacteria bacterium]